MSDHVSKISIDDLFEAAASGVLRGLRAREASAERLVASGFTVRIDLTCGGPLLQYIQGFRNQQQPGPAGGVAAE